MVEDGWASNGPHMKWLKSLDMRCILGARRADPTARLEWVESTERMSTGAVQSVEHTDQAGRASPVPLPQRRPAQRHAHGVDAWRPRWRIENETFNTLKNQGDCFEHNFGHGARHLAMVFADLMMLAFLIDTRQQRAWFQAVQAKAGRARYLRERLRALFFNAFLADWETLYKALASRVKQEWCMTLRRPAPWPGVG